MVLPLIAAGLTAAATVYAANKASQKPKSPKVKKAELRTKEQQELDKLINEGLTKGTGPFADLFGKFDEAAFEKGVTQPALKQFKEKTLPSLQEQLIAGNASHGSSLRRAQTGAVTDLQERLAGLEYQARNQQNQNRIAGITGQQRGGQFENIGTPAQPSAAQDWIKAGGQITSDLLKSYRGSNNEAAKTPAVTTPATSAVPGGV